jgi:hypothetical protein
MECGLLWLCKERSQPEVSDERKEKEKGIAFSLKKNNQVISKEAKGRDEEGFPTGGANTQRKHTKNSEMAVRCHLTSDYFNRPFYYFNRPFHRWQLAVFISPSHHLLISLSPHIVYFG